MTTQQTFFAPASFSGAAALSPIVKTLLRTKLLALGRGILIQDDLIAEIDRFCDRNNFKPPENELHTSCPDCLKAHALKTAARFGSDSRSIAFLSAFLKGNIGHDGYYLDGEELIKLAASA